MNNIIKKTNEFEKKVSELAASVVKLARNSLLVNLRFLDASINELKLEENYKIPSVLCDGSKYIYNPKYILLSYKEEKEIPVHDYLHSLLHCIFRHMYVNTLLNTDLWDIACDIAVENTLIELNLSCANTNKQVNENNYIKQLKAKNIKITAEKLYAYFLNSNLSDKEISYLKSLFSSDDHSIWYMSEMAKEEYLGMNNFAFNVNSNNEMSDNQDGSSKLSRSMSEKTKEEYLEMNNSAFNADSDDEMSDNQNESSKISSFIFGKAKEERWKQISERMQEEITSFVEKKQGFGSGDMLQNLKEVNREKYDYTSFLKKFAVMGEAMQINDDEFDYIFYTYGLKMYKNMPLIEPLEYKDVKKIRDFVIAIDTSGSVMGDEVQNFLTKTYNILMSEESFFKKINVHIIQCDAEIQEDKVIHNRNEFEEYIKTMRLRGFGGTDFRPVFSYVNELIDNKAFTNLKGLLYFTDGYGTFPEKGTDYQTAFVFVDDGYEVPEVPSWAIKLKLEKSDLK